MRGKNGFHEKKEFFCNRSEFGHGKCLFFSTFWFPFFFFFLEDLKLGGLDCFF